MTAADDVTRKHREGHERDGTTVGVFFPAGCPWSTYMDLSDRIAEMVFAADLGGVDAFVFARGGDCNLVPVTPEATP